jgi:mitochondrial fission protein ELM1
MADDSTKRNADFRAEAQEAPSSNQETMECVVLPPRPGAPASNRPPVEIFLGTEPAQYRANRVFGWSIEKVRDPGREIRIHLMSELTGFDRRGWTTGFTNFRFAIPALLGGRGRAIYNDEDQIYLTDPGELFDLDLGSAAYLSISDTESSVMLIDCERMAPVWTLHEAQHAWKRRLLRKASKDTGLRGDLDPGWNARDEEFEPGRSQLLHYTTLHTQPWRPFPERFVYQKGSYTQLWHDLEREAIAEGFELFTAETPSRGFRGRLAALQRLPLSEMGSGIGTSGEVAGAVEELTRKTKARTLLEVQPDLRGDDEQSPGRFGLDHERRVGLLEWLSGLDPEERFDGVLCLEGLEDLPVWDIPWLIESLFRRARRFVFVSVRTPLAAPRRRFLLPPQGTTHTREWWESHFEAASARHPEISWNLMSARGNAFESDCVHLRSGGPRPDATPPSVWTLTDGEPGNDAQVDALASVLGWPRDQISPEMGPFSRLPFVSRGAHLRGLDAQSSGRTRLHPPWPDLLIVAGRRVAPVARWVRVASRGRTRVVALGAKAATPADEVDLAVTPRGAMLFPHPHRIEIDRPLVVSDPMSFAKSSATSAWQDRLASLSGGDRGSSDEIGIGSGRRLVLTIGSGTERLGLDGTAAEALGRLVAESASGLGASVFVSASRHARPEVFEGVLRGLGRVAFVHHETADQRPEERPWTALLESADLFVMAGLGETSLAEICATGRPVFLTPQLRSGRRFWSGLRDRWLRMLVERAQARPANDRGTTRPQEGLELLCARLIDRGWVRPRRDVEALRGRLVRNGHARLLRAPIRGSDLEGFAGPVESEIEGVADRIREMLGVVSEHGPGGEETR